MKKILITLTCFAIILSCFATTVFAATNEEISTRANNVSYTSTKLKINDSGVATVQLSYYGFEGVTTNGKITTKLQKRFLLIFWQDVDGGSWTDYGSGVNYSTSHSISVKSGYYRVQAEYVIYGIGGSPDTIIDQDEAEY